MPPVASQDLPDIAALFAQALQGVPRSQQPLLVAAAERMAAERYGHRVEKLFVADGNALCMPMDHWLPILEDARYLFPRLRRVSCYAMASDVLDKTSEELTRLRAEGL